MLELAITAEASGWTLPFDLINLSSNLLGRSHFEKEIQGPLLPLSSQQYANPDDSHGRIDRCSLALWKRNPVSWPVLAAALAGDKPWKLKNPWSHPRRESFIALGGTCLHYSVFRTLKSREDIRILVSPGRGDRVWRPCFPILLQHVDTFSHGLLPTSSIVELEDGESPRSLPGPICWKWPRGPK